MQVVDSPVRAMYTSRDAKSHSLSIYANNVSFHVTSQDHRLSVVAQTLYVYDMSDLQTSLFSI